MKEDDMIQAISDDVDTMLDEGRTDFAFAKKLVQEWPEADDFSDDEIDDIAETIAELARADSMADNDADNAPDSQLADIVDKVVDDEAERHPAPDSQLADIVDKVVDDEAERHPASDSQLADIVDKVVDDHVRGTRNGYGESNSSAADDAPAEVKMVKINPAIIDAVSRRIV